MFVYQVEAGQIKTPDDLFIVVKIWCGEPAMLFGLADNRRTVQNTSDFKFKVFSSPYLSQAKETSLL